MPILNIKKYDLDINEEYTIIRNIVPAPITNEFVVNINDMVENNDSVFTYLTELPAFDFSKFKDISSTEFPSWNSVEIKSTRTNTYKYFITPISQIGEPTAYIDTEEYRLPFIKTRIAFSTLAIRPHFCGITEYTLPMFAIGSFVLDPDKEYFIMSSITPGI